MYTNFPMNVIPSGILSLDIALSVGGLPRGSMVEFFGPAGCGKTSVCLNALAAAQAAGSLAAFVDAEHALDRAYAARLGVNVNTLLYTQPKDGDEALGIAAMLAESGAVGVIALDSVASLEPAGERQNPGEMQPSRSQAQMLSQGLRRLKGAARSGATLILLTNQLRQRIRASFDSPEVSPGGIPLHLQAEIRIELQPGAKQAGSLRVHFHVLKNKYAAPGPAGSFELLDSGGISRAGDALDLGLACRLAEKQGSVYTFAGQSLGRGRAAALETLRQNCALLEELERAIRRRCLPPPPVRLEGER